MAQSSAALFLGLDVGTQGTKGLLLDDTGRVLARAAKNYGLIPGLPAGAAEQHPDTWVAAVTSVASTLLSETASDPNRVRGIGVSGQQHGLVVLDDRGEVVRPAKLWCDTQTAAEASELAERFGRPVPTGFTASKILWLIRHEPNSWQRTRRILLPHDYINWRLCGEAFMEAGDASGTGLFDPENRKPLEYSHATNARNQAQAAVDLAVSEHGQAKERLARCTIRSPIAGRVAAVFYEEGELMRPSQPVAEIVNLSRLKLVV